MFHITTFAADASRYFLNIQLKVMNTLRHTIPFLLSPKSTVYKYIGYLVQMTAAMRYKFKVLQWSVREDGKLNKSFQLKKQ